MMSRALTQVESMDVDTVPQASVKAPPEGEDLYARMKALQVRMGRALDLMWGNLSWV